MVMKKAEELYEKANEKNVGLYPQTELSEAEKQRALNSEIGLAVMQ